MEPTKAPSNHRKLGIFLIVAPPLTIIFVLFAFAAASTILGAGALGNDGILILTIVNFILGLLGLISVIGVIVGIPLGIYFVVTSFTTKTDINLP